MKLNEIMEQDEQKGTYAGVRFDEDSVNRINTFIQDNNIPQGVPDDKLHSTLLYSRKHIPEYEPTDPIDPPLIATPTRFDVWQSQPDDDTGETNNCLVLEYECPGLVDRHTSLMDSYDATYDYDEYKPHVTLSYNIGDMDASKLDPSSIGDLSIVKEYQEDLNIGWAKDNT